MGQATDPPNSGQGRGAAAACAALVRQLLWPIHCLGCGGAAEHFLCCLCRGSCQRHTGSRCRRCDDSSATPICARCRARSSSALTAARSVWRYSGPIAQAVRAGKHSGHEGVWALLAEDIGRDHEATVLAQAASALVPIPLSARRRLSRGYNPSALLAQALGELWHKPVRHLLRSPLWARRAPQSRLDAPARQHNMAHAFAPARPSVSLTGLTLLLVDDVITTGATLSSAAQTLRALGADRVLAVAVARQTLEHGI